MRDAIKSASSKTVLFDIEDTVLKMWKMHKITDSEYRELTRMIDKRLIDIGDTMETYEVIAAVKIIVEAKNPDEIIKNQKKIFNDMHWKNICECQFQRIGKHVDITEWIEDMRYDD